MKVILAAGVFYPDVGGPAIHVEKIAERFSAEGIETAVVAYGDDPSQKQFPFLVKRISRRLPKPFQWVLYFFTLLRKSFNIDVIYAFDPTAAGLPACLVSFILRKPFVIRIGGDPIWERVVETGKRFITIEEYYEKVLYKEDKPLLYKLIRAMFKRAKAVVVYNENFKIFYSKYFAVDEDRIKIVKNPAFVRERTTTPLSADPLILFAGRFVAYKNLPFVLRVFRKIRNNLGKGKLYLIGTGPDKNKLTELVGSLALDKSVVFIDSLPQEKLFEYIKESALCIAPALNEFNPNFILEALSFGKPVLLSRGHGLSVDLSDEFLFDPRSKDELYAKLSALLEPENYKLAVQKIQAIPLDQTWEKVTDFHLDLIKRL